MNKLLVDTNILLDLFLDDPIWADWSEMTLERYHASHKLIINPVIYTEASIGFERIEALEEAIAASGFQMEEIPKEALFLTGKIFLQYRKNKGAKLSPLPDFFIGAHAAVLDIDLITRDITRYRAYFPTVNLIAP